MPIYSGNIGESIEFDVLNAGTITGVKFGASAISKNFKVQPDSVSVLARVPTDAHWGPVSFYKTNQTTVYNVAGSGYANSGALSDLQSELTSLGLYSASCTSGDIVYSNSYQATAICDLRVTGNSESEVSGVIYNAYGSGYCGDNTNGFTSSGYSENNTRLNNYSTFQNQSGDWLAIGFVEDTGNFIYKTAKLDVTCSEASVETTNYSFVPIPLITDFNPKEASQGDNLKIVGNALSGVTSVTINDTQVSHQVVSNYEITGSIPAGTFAHKVQVVGASGLKGTSLNEFVSFSPLAGAPLDRTLKITSGQSITVNQGSTDNVNIMGSNISGLTLAQLTDENSVHTSVFGDSSFGYTSDQVSFSPQNLQVGVYDITIANSLNSASSDNVLKVIGTPSFSYSYSGVSSVALINEPQNYNDRQSTQSAFANKTYSFSTTQDVERFCLKFENNSATSGFASYELQQALVNPASTHIDKYFIKGTGDSWMESMTIVGNKWRSGVWTTDEHGNEYDQSAYKLQPCLCEITSSGNSQYGFSADASFVTLYATGTAQTGNDAAIKQENTNSITQDMTANYPDYTLNGIAHHSANNVVTYNYGSGISYPFATNILTNCSNSFWDKLYASGKSELYPYGNTATGIVSSGCSHSSSNNFSYNTTLSGVSNSESTARSNVEIEKNNYYVNCQTGNYNVSTITSVQTIIRSGTTHGYC
tara:strand:- start:158 stop:2269 length:2112 start_codon:yes stop_codon:yes gene_type:complete